MADVLLTHSYFLRFDPKEYKAMMPYPPLGTLYAASTLREQGYSVALFDSMLANDERDLIHHINTHRPRVVAIYDDDFNYLTKMCLTRMRQAACKMAEIARREGCTVIVHGSDPVDHLEPYFAAGADYVICGEGEETLSELVQYLFQPGAFPRENISGLAFKERATTIRTSPRRVLHDLDLLPFPAWDLVDISRYRRIWKARHGYFSINMVTTRGCPFHCNWCAKPIYGQIYNSRTPKNVVHEMQTLRDTIHPDHIWFCDDIFGLKPGWVEEFAREVLSKGVATPFKCLSRADLLLRGNTTTHLRRAGCRTVWLGAESGSQKILDAMEKGTTVEQIYTATAHLKRAGIGVGFFLQYGYPGETRKDINLTLRMLKECKPDEIGVSVSYPLPGTKFFDMVRKQMGEKLNWVDSQDLALMFTGTYVPDFYRALHTVTHKRFRIWQGFDMLREAITRPDHLTYPKLRRIAATAYHLATLPPQLIRLAKLETQSHPLQ